MNTTTDTAPEANGSFRSNAERLIHYGSSRLPEEILKTTKQAVRLPGKDMDYIRATAITNSQGGEADVRDHCSRQFGAENAELEEECRRLTHLVAADISGVERQLGELSRLLSTTERYLESVGTAVPWTPMARTNVICLLVLSVLLLAVGINTNATVLMSSGISAFATPFRAYLFSLIPIGIAAAFKVPCSHIEQRKHRVLYTLVIWMIGIVFGIIWAGMFASTFPGMTQDTASLIDSLTNASTTANPEGHSSNGSFIFVAILAEALLAAGCWLTAQLIIEKHQPSTRTDNPAYLKAQADVNHWQSRKCENERLAAGLAGKLRAIDDTRRHFVESAVADFRAAVRLAGEQRYLESFLKR